MQLIVVRSRQDSVVLRLESAVFGVQPTVWSQRFVTPPLTEWMMFAYVICVVSYRGLAALFDSGAGFIFGVIAFTTGSIFDTAAIHAMVGIASDTLICLGHRAAAGSGSVSGGLGLDSSQFWN